MIQEDNVPGWPLPYNSSYIILSIATDLPSPYIEAKMLSMHTCVGCRESVMISPLFYFHEQRILLSHTLSGGRARKSPGK